MSNNSMRSLSIEPSESVIVSRLDLRVRYREIARPRLTTAMGAKPS